MSAPLESEELNFDLDALPMDVFDLAESGLAVESLTAGHGMAENGASIYSCSGICACGWACSACNCSSS